MKWVKVLLWLALVSLVWGGVERLPGVPYWFFGVNVTPSAFLRFSDTLILFAIAIMLLIKFSKTD